MRKSGWLAPRPRRYYLTEVHVHPEYRGQGYCTLLLLNVMYHFDQLRSKTEPMPPMVFELATYRNNHAAIRAYRKVFGEPVYGHGTLVYFSTESKNTPHP